MNKASPPEGTIRAALRYPAFRSLLTGLAVSQVGDWLYNLALVTVVYTRTGSVLWAGIATGARVVPMVVLGPVGGVIADRYDRRRVMVASDLLRLALMVGLAVVVAARLPVVLAPVIAALATTAGTPYLACVAATTPRLIRDGDLPGANAARSAVTSIGIIVGPAIGGVLLLLGSPAIAFAVNAVTFGAGAACVLAIRAPGAFTVRAAAPGAPSRPGAGGQVTSVLGSVFAGIADGAAALRAHPAAIRLVGADLACSVVYGMQTVVLVLVADRAGLGMHGYGYLFAALGVGSLIGISLAGRALRLPFRPGLALAMCLVGLSMLALPAARWGILAIVLVAVSGAGAILVEVMTETGLQRMLPEEVFGRAYGLALPASVAGIVAGSLIAPVLVSVIGLTGALVTCGGVATAYGLQLIAGRRRASARAASHPVPLAPSATPADLAPTAPWPTAIPHPTANPGRTAAPRPAPALWPIAAARPAAVPDPTVSSWPAGTAHPGAPVALDPALAPTAPWPTIISRPAVTSVTSPPR